MTPLAIRMYRFGSVINEQEFRFPQKPGLYFMQGINHVEPRLGSNGAGKSTIFAALCWVLFGKTPKGLKAGDAANWDDGKGSWVELEFEGGVMRRSWSPNKWTLNGADLTKDETNPVLALLRLEFLPFMNCVLMAQREPMFLDMKPEPKAALFADVMGLDLWLDLSSKASRKAIEQETFTRYVEKEVSELTGKLDAWKDDDTQANFDLFERKRKGRIDAVEAVYKDELPKVDKSKAYLSDARKNADDLRKAWKEKQEHYNGIVKSLASVRIKLDEKRSELAVRDSTTKALQDTRDNLMKEKSCPTCGRPFDAQHWAIQLGRMTKAYGDNVELGKTLYGRFKALEHDHAAMQETATRADKDERRSKDDYEIADRISHQALLDLEALERKLDQLEDEVERINKETNPFEAVLKNRAADKSALTEQFNKVKAELDDSTERTSMLTAWVKGFKEIRLSLIAETLEQLEIEVNSSMTELGLTNWEQMFDIDRETKAGSLQRGFSVRILSPHNARPVPWEAWSGGEGQRLRLAAQMGLSDLIRTRTGATIPLEVWDEPSGGMTAEGISDLLNCLKARAIAERRIIFIVDHHSLGYSGFDGTFTVIKTRTGSRFE